ncbi:MAG: glycosyltransferase family 4 protein [Pseudomonadales bacterium]
MIAFAIFKYFPYGGQQRDFLNVALACQARGYHIRVYTLSWQGERPEGFEIVVLRVAGFANHARYRRFAARLADDLAWRPAACMVGFNKLPGLDVYYAADPCFADRARARRAPLYRLTRRYRLFSRFERQVFDPQADTRVLLITPRQREPFQRCYGTPAHRFSVLPAGVDRDRQRGTDAAAVRRALRREFAVGDHELLVLLIGSGFVTKGLDRALLAVAALPDGLRERVRLFVIGQDKPRQFIAMAEQLGIGPRVRIFAGRDDIPRFLQGGDLLLHPAYSESGGIVLLEAIIAGLPVLATDVCGFAPYVLESGAGALVASPFSQAALNEALRRALEDDAQRAAWSANGVRFGREADIYGMAERAADLIEERLRGPALSA